MNKLALLPLLLCAACPLTQTRYEERLQEEANRVCEVCGGSPSDCDIPVPDPDELLVDADCAYDAGRAQACLRAWRRVGDEACLDPEASPGALAGDAAPAACAEVYDCSERGPDVDTADPG